MNELDLLKQIITGCDEALKEGFTRRMNVAPNLAKSKLELGIPLYIKQDEDAYIASATAHFTPDLILKAISLWKSLTRMSRNQQYRYLLKNHADVMPAHERQLTSPLTDRAWVATEEICEQTALHLGRAVSSVKTAREAVDMLLSSAADAAILDFETIGRSDDAMSLIYAKDIYIDSIFTDSQNRRLGVLSRTLHRAQDDNIMTLAFAVTAEYGSLVQALDMLADAKLSIENMYFRRAVKDSGDPDNLVFINLSGDFDSIEVRTALFQMETELVFFRVMGFWKQPL